MLAFNEIIRGHDAYWTPIEAVALSELPAKLFQAVPEPKTIVSMAAYGTSVFDIPGATPVGEFYFLVDAERGSILSTFCQGEESTRPIRIPGSDVNQAASVLKDHCRKIRWQTSV